MDRRSVLINALKKAAREILKYDPTIVDAHIKSTPGDFVTAADIASEKIILSTIKEYFPDDIVISEESPEGQELLKEESLSQLSAWVIDPIDGTNNFKRGMAYSGISIGYIENGEAVLGGILDPYRSLLYVSEINNGATCNGDPIHVSSQSIFNSNTRVCTSNSYEGGTLQNLARYKKLGDVWVDVLSSAVLIMTDVASGKLDLYHHNGLKPWDNAAGFLIAKEAGAKIVGLNGKTISWLSNEVLMGNPALVDEFLRLQSTS